MMRSVKRSRARRLEGVVGAEEIMWEKSVVPVRAAKPDCLLRISSACVVVGSWVRDYWVEG